jgi:hypothetical protein
LSEGLIGSEETAPQETDSGAGGTEQGGDDFITRVETDPEFAKDQIRKRDSQVSKLSNQVKELEPVAQLVNLAGGTDRLVEYATIGSRVDTVPGLRDLVTKALETGRVDLPQAEPAATDEDTWIDPDTKAYVDPLKAQVAELQQTIAQLTQVATQADVRSKEQRVKENIEKALSRFEAVPEAHQEASEIIHREYAKALAAAERGDPVQADLIDKLSSDGGAGILKNVTVDVFEKHLVKLAEAMNTKPKEDLSVLGKATDSAAMAVPNTGSAQKPALPKGRVSDRTVLEMLRANARKAGYELQ